MTAAWRRREILALPGLLLLAAALRLPDLATRGTWDADQGHDMLMLRALVRDGVVPLLGPPTSIGDVHHGALYYYLLAPAAAVTGGDSPLAVVAWIALAGIAAVGVTWWLARRWLARSRGRGRPGDGHLPRRGRRIDVHLEPEPDRAVECGGAGRRMARLDEPADPAGGWWPPSGRPSPCNATCWASRCCRSSVPCSSRTSAGERRHPNDGP